MSTRLVACQSELEEYKTKVANRDQEIARLHNSYQGGQSFSAVKGNADIQRVHSENKNLTDLLQQLGAIFEFKSQLSPQSADHFLQHMHSHKKHFSMLQEDN